MLGKLYLVRHGESVGNVWPDVYRREEQNFLSPYGVQQSALCGSYFHRKGIAFHHVFSSNLTRARHTTSTILHAMQDWQRFWIVDERFKEISSDDFKSLSRVHEVSYALEHAKLGLEHGNVLVVSHYHTMQYLFDALKVKRERIDSHQGRHVGNAHPFVWDPQAPDKITALDLSNLGPQT